MSNKCKSEGKMGSKEKKYCGSKYGFQGLDFLNYKTFILRLGERLSLNCFPFSFTTRNHLSQFLIKKKEKKRKRKKKPHKDKNK